jgi:hypothetical protein
MSYSYTDKYPPRLRSNASFLSKITYAYVTNLILLGNKKTFSEHDIPNVE